MIDLEQTSGGAAVSAAPTKQAAFFRGCSCLSCTNKTDDILQGVQRSPLHQQSRRHSSGGAAVSAAPTKQTTFFRGCSCLSCTNKANGIHVLGWCTSWLVHLRQVHPLGRTQNPLNPINPLLILRVLTSVKSVGEHRCLRYFNNGFIGLNGFVGGVIIGLNGC